MKHSEEAKHVSPYEDDGGEEGAENTDGREYQRYQRPRTRPGYDLGGELNATRHREIWCKPGIAVLACVIVHIGILPAGDATPTTGFLEIIVFFITRGIVNPENEKRIINRLCLELMMNNEPVVAGCQYQLLIIVINN